MSYRKLGLIVIILVVFSITPSVAAAQVGVSIVSPTCLSVQQASAATCSIDTVYCSFSSGYPSPGTCGNVTLTLNGLPQGAAYRFSPNPVSQSVTDWHGSSTLTIDTSTLPLYCPRAYTFTVTATPPETADAGTSSAYTLAVAQVGPPLQVSVSTGKPAYRTGDTISIFVSVTRAAEGQLQLTPPSGAPMTYTFHTTGPASGVAQKLTAGQTFGTYTVTVLADDYCGGASSASTTFTVSPDTYDATISLSGLPSQLSAMLQVDGQNQGTIQGSQTKTVSFKIGSSHSITVDQYVAGDKGVRYYSSQNSWSVSSTDSHTFNYQPQYQFSVLTDPGNVTPTTGGGWYNEGASVQTNQAPQTVRGPSGAQYAFKDWELDGTAQAGNQLTVTMNKPHTAIAKYATQYELVIDSPGGIGSPQGAGFYDVGSTATFSVTSPVGFLVQQVFVRWEGDYTGTSPQGSITMDKTKTVHAVWTTSYTQLYVAVGVAAAAIVLAAFYIMRRHRGEPKSPEPSKPSQNAWTR